MSSPIRPTLVRPIAGLLFNEQKIQQSEILERLKSLWPDFEVTLQTSPKYYSLNNYYSKEMGQSDCLQRYWVCFDRLIEREELVKLKVQSNKLERELKAENSGRVVNIDPGYLALEQLVLATGKPYGHRLFLGRYEGVGIYGELTYIFENKKWHELPWTYPDYRLDEVRDFFLKCRKELHKTLKTL